MYKFVNFINWIFFKFLSRNKRKRIVTIYIFRYYLYLKLRHVCGKCLIYTSHSTLQIHIPDVNLNVSLDKNNRINNSILHRATKVRYFEIPHRITREKSYGTLTFTQYKRFVWNRVHVLGCKFKHNIGL